GVGDNDDDRLWGRGAELLGDVTDDLGVHFEEVHPAHTGFPRQTCRHDTDIRAGRLGVGVRPDNSGFEALDRTRLHHVQREALWQPFDDVGHDDLVGEARLGDALDRSRSVLPRPDDRYFHRALSI